MGRRISTLAPGRAFRLAGLLCAALLFLLPAALFSQSVVIEELPPQVVPDSAPAGGDSAPAGGDSAAPPAPLAEPAPVKRNVFIAETSQPKNKALAAFYSALVPGLGEFYLGQPKRLRNRLLTDGFILLATGGIKLVQYQQQHNARLYLAATGHCPAADTVSNYDLLKIASLYQDSDSLRLELEEPARTPPDSQIKLQWYFSTRAEWEEYQKLWNWAETWGVYASYSLAGLALNRIFSVMNTYFLGRRMKPTQTASPRPVSGEFYAEDLRGQPALCYRLRF